MAREVSLHREAHWFVPDIGDNRKDPDPFKVFVTPLTGAESDRLSQAELGITGSKSRNTVAMGQRYVERIIREHVREVKGYAGIDAEGKRIEATDGASLLKLLALADDAEQSAVIEEIMGEIRGVSRLRGDIPKA